MKNLPIQTGDEEKKPNNSGRGFKWSKETQSSNLCCQKDKSDMTRPRTLSYIV